MYGVGPDLAQEITARNYDLVKSGSLKVKIEPKPEFKGRFGRSPDLADAAFLALDCARQRLGLVAIDPPQTGSGPIRPPVTISQLNNALDNSETVLLD